MLLLPVRRVEVPERGVSTNDVRMVNELFGRMAALLESDDDDDVGREGSRVPLGRPERTLALTEEGTFGQDMPRRW